ncbi:tyrosine-type recombinase/integrase [Thiobaca trueperi]|uniref:Site-specific recombinase XerD n=1 Tax=Thiobaca trueperi TaxID=127458 RepID=A0A4R3N296_9GAMM|nr:site-specific integrase [Thiobaca trueperi]TCT21173.1 site-specific recombinase XerD [Thiobaca trueperi]
MPRKRKQDQDGLYRRPDSPNWWASYTDASGQRVRCSTGATDRQEADALLAKWKLEAHREKQWGEQPSRTFDELMIGYLKASEADKRPSGFQRDKEIVRNLRQHFGGLELTALTPALVRRYVDQRRVQVTNGTVNRELCVLSSAINYARREWEWDIPNPVPGRKLRTPEGRIRWITREESKRLLDEASREPQAPHLVDFIRLAINTGCRKGELLGLEWKRIDLRAGLIHLEADHTKTLKRRSVPINADAREAILSRAQFRMRHCPASPWVFCHEDGSRVLDVKRSFTTARKRAGIEDFRVHDLRHTCAAWLVSAGVPLTAVRDLLGHTTVKMTERYAHLAPENVRAAVALLEGMASRSGHVEKLKVVSGGL